MLKYWKSCVLSLAIFGLFWSQPLLAQQDTTVSSDKAGTKRVRAEYLPSVIMQAQTALKTKGFYKGEANGKMDGSTKDAVKAFQEKQGIMATGRLNKDTRQLLGIEPDTSDNATKKSASKNKELKPNKN
jgi:peptidoglycan hydrolase-like protein with peptidoglycan-binding domain